MMQRQAEASMLWRAVIIPVMRRQIMAWCGAPAHLAPQTHGGAGMLTEAVT
jgi:hypothetical protein